MTATRPVARMMTLKLYDEERDKLRANAAAAGLSMSAFIRWRCIDDPNGERLVPRRTDELDDEPFDPPPPVVVVSVPARILRWK